MREIKFRVWDGKRMQYDVTAGRFGVFYVNPGANGDGLDEKDSASLTPFNTKYADATPLLQYTGLRDADGKEIYEGDVLQWQWRGCSRLLTVYWALRTASFATEDVWDTDPMHKHGSMPYEGHIRIVGNVYENPELVPAP